MSHYLRRRLLPKRARTARLLHALSPFAFALALAFGVGVVSPPSSDAAELSAFFVTGGPGAWGTGAGGALTITILDIAAVEGEIANMVGEVLDQDMWTASGAALIRPTFGRFQPFGGLAVGVYRQSAGPNSVSGTSSALVLGLKVKLVLGVGLKAEYRRIGLTDTPLIDLRDRYSIGAALTF